MKKVTALLLAATMAMSLAGCSQKAAEPAATAAANSGGGASAATEAPAAERKIKGM